MKIYIDIILKETQIYIEISFNIYFPMKVIHDYYLK